MSGAGALLDPYSLRARLQPALLAIAPLLICGFALAPSAWEPARSIFAVAGGLGGAVFLSQIARDLGKQLEPRLYRAWNGKPSLAMLRHRDERVPVETKRRYHAALARAIGRPMPSAQQESDNATAADDIYEAANAWLLANTRDAAEYRLLFAENMNYGFRRNLLALKPTAVVFFLTAFAALLLAFWQGWPTMASRNLLLLGLAGVIIYAALLLLIVRRSWVKRAADAYAIRLLEASDRIPA